VRNQNVFSFDEQSGTFAPVPTEIPVRELARRSGVSHTQISRIESGAIASPAAEQLIALAKALGYKPAPLLILAGYLSGEDARIELATLFYDGAELRDVWGDWMHHTWEDTSRLVHDPATPADQLSLIAYDVFTAGETAQTIWEEDDLLLLLETGQHDLRELLIAWRFFMPERREQLLTYTRALRRIQELEELAEAETWRMDAATIPAGDDPVSASEETTLAEAGFEGFLRLSALVSDMPGVPASPGVYVVIRRSTVPPEFLDRSVGGHFKGEDPTVPVERLAPKWVPDTNTLYFGRASNLRSRIKLLARYGNGEPVAHRGGRYLWQLADHHDLIVAWQETTDQVAREAELVANFEDRHAMLPFANLNRPGGGD
jgi:transcriptional regulator with XRE-family HTH domain